MYLTEEEARKKWCPQVRITLIESGPSPSHNRVCMEGNTYNAIGANCIASECMMWRWGSKFETGEEQEDLRQMDEKSTKGYCGLGDNP